MRRLIRFAIIFILTVWLVQLHSPTDIYAQSPATSQVVTWSCTGSPCPWGGVINGQAIVWPAALGPIGNRLGYSTSAGIYLPASAASGMTIAITAGTATVYAGQPDNASHRVLATVAAGQTHLVTGLAAGEVISVQGSQLFTYELTLPPPVTATPTTAPGTPTATAMPAEPSPTATPLACTDPMTCNPVSSIEAVWRCNLPGCTAPEWIATVLSWPSWSAYDHNARTGNNSRTVYSAEGENLYAYMGAWADGCQVTAISGRVLIIEWQRGTDVWRETTLMPGETHTISLIPPENGALIETYDHDPVFTVSLANCIPQALPATPASAETSATMHESNHPVVDGAGDGATTVEPAVTSQLFLPLIAAGHSTLAADRLGEGSIATDMKVSSHLFLPLILTDR